VGFGDGLGRGDGFGDGFGVFDGVGRAVGPFPGTMTTTRGVGWGRGPIVTVPPGKTSTVGLTTIVGAGSLGLPRVPTTKKTATNNATAAAM